METGFYDSWKPYSKFKKQRQLMFNLQVPNLVPALGGQQFLHDIIDFTQPVRIRKLRFDILNCQPEYYPGSPTSLQWMICVVNDPNEAEQLLSWMPPLPAPPPIIPIGYETNFEPESSVLATGFITGNGSANDREKITLKIDLRAQEGDFIRLSVLINQNVRVCAFRAVILVEE